MERRARSLSRFPEGIYERADSRYSTKLSVRRPDIYERSRSVGPLGYISSTSLPVSFYDGPRLRRRAVSVGPVLYEPSRSYYYTPLRAASPYRPYSLYDVDLYDRYSERVREPTSVRALGYPYQAPSDTFVARYLSSIDRVGRVHDYMRELDYRRSLRALRLSMPTSVYKWSGSPWEWLSSARDYVHQTVRNRVPYSYGFRVDNPRDYYGRSYISMERNGVNQVRSRYNYIEKNVDQRPSAWAAEDQVERGYDLQQINDSTLPSIYDSLNLVDASRENLLMDRAGVVPRFYHMASGYLQAKASTDYSKRMVDDFRRFKDKTIERLSTPWSFTRYA